MFAPSEASRTFPVLVLLSIVLFGYFLAFVVWPKLALSKPRVRFPPGPRGDPIIGNARDLPSEYQYVKYHEWSKQYRSDLIHLKIFGQSLVVLNSYNVVTDLLEKRATLYSDRPQLTMTADLMGFGWATILTPYNSELKINRRLLHHAFNPSATRAYAPLQERCMSEFLQKALESPLRLDEHVKQLAASISLEMAYGRKISRSYGSELLKTVSEGMHYWNIGVSAGWFVDFLPILKHVPAWLPGAHFRRVARSARPVSSRMLEEPFRAVKASMHEQDAGISDISFTHNLLAGEGHITGAKNEEDFIKRNAATLFGAASDTTVSSLMSFILGMTLHPEFQSKAQSEIDRVIGNNRLPTLADRPNLPYVNCIVKEVLRSVFSITANEFTPHKYLVNSWNPSGPIGSPRRVMEDDVYNGMLIPKGATIIANVWALMHDQSVYDKPFEFNPDRFDCEHPPRDPHLMAFGFGRRICPGLPLSSATIFLFVAQVLATFNIRKAVDQSGAEITPAAKFTSGVISHPAPFEYKMYPKSQRAAQLILSLSDSIADD
ncbi:cytochrome P450 [Cantharellus anzutake]|uniref:cytochrome P450 n=1 Tax=Cantharellus anzutake TaxID=1750568 RepID=UPI001902FB69|nr:cytochrome P450 [Cantharellus anzutake]KAF8337882.1 cytochrome P450 [Cantharellus anzutake]